MGNENSKNKCSSNYVVPLRQDMEQYPYYNEQEQTYTDLSQLDSVHGGSYGNEGPNSGGEPNYYDLYMKMNVSPTQEVTNPDWGDGNFCAPKENQIQREFNRTPNEMDQLYDVQKGASILDMDLGHRASRVVDAFLNENSKDIFKVANMDLTDFMKISDETLIHKSNKDLWKMMKDAEGNIYIQRLFEGEVLKD